MMTCHKCYRDVDDGKYAAPVYEVAWKGGGVRVKKLTSSDQADPDNVVYCARCAQEVTLAEVMDDAEPN